MNSFVAAIQKQLGVKFKVNMYERAVGGWAQFEEEPYDYELIYEADHCYFIFISYIGMTKLGVIHDSVCYDSTYVMYSVPLICHAFTELIESPYLPLKCPEYANIWITQSEDKKTFWNRIGHTILAYASEGQSLEINKATEVRAASFAISRAELTSQAFQIEKNARVGKNLL